MENEGAKKSKDRPAGGEQVPTFDEGESRPAPIESTGNDNVRSMPPSSPATPGRAGNNEGGEDLDPQNTD